jgi:hypothetical protein
MKLGEIDVDDLVDALHWELDRQIEGMVREAARDGWIAARDGKKRQTGVSRALLPLAHTPRTPPLM